jgi:phosphate transport system substrate-binding protein
MKPNQVIYALSAIALMGLSSCSTSSLSSSSPSSSSPSSASEKTADSNAQSAIKAGVSSSSVDFLKTLKTAYLTTYPENTITLLEPSQSEAIVAGIKQGIVDIGAISKALKPEENDGTLQSREVAHDALLVATHSSVTGITNVTTENLKAIYSGSITNWQELGGPDADIVVLDRPEDESAKRLLRKHYLGDDLKNAPNAVVLRKEGELIQTLQSTPYSIGAFSLAHAISHKLPVNRLNLNNIEPTPANLKTEKYPMVRTISVIWGKKSSAATQALIDYIFSPQGAEVLERSGFAAIAAADADVK